MVVWNLDTYESHTWDRSLDPDVFCFECECEIFFEILDLVELGSFGWLESKLYDLSLIHI